MINCPKCGGMAGSPRYDKLRDKLEYRCMNCGYTRPEEPLDKRSTPRAARALVEDADAQTREATDA